jgi:hypothetical protein
MSRSSATTSRLSRLAATFAMAWVLACACVPVGAHAERAATVLASAEIVRTGEHTAAASFALSGVRNLAYEVVMPAVATATTDAGESLTIALSIAGDAPLVLGSRRDSVALDAAVVVPDAGLTPGSYEASISVAVAYQ